MRTISRVSRLGGRKLCGVCLVGWALAAVGCGDSTQGTVQVAPETRQKLTPHASEARTGSGLHPVAGKSFSIKDRAPRGSP
jgi:hypothetical protein